jgi:hypothetical protein
METTIMAKAKKAAPKGKSKGKSSTVVSVNFEGVEGKRSTLPDDDYLCEVESVEIKDGNGDYQYLAVTSTVQSGKFKGSKIWDNLSLSPNALWRLRAFLEVLGMEVPDEEMDVDTDEMVGCTFVAVTSQEKYKNDAGDKKVAVRVSDFYSADDFEEKDSEDAEEEDEEEEKPKSKAKAGKKSKKDEDEDEEESEEESDDDAEEDEDETPEEKKKRLRKERRAARKAAESSDEDEDEDEKPKKKGKKSKDEEEEEDEEEEDEKPKKKSKKGKAKKYTTDEVNESDEEGLEAIIEASGIEVDLSDFKTLRKKCAAVIDALEEAELIEDDE